MIHFVVAVGTPAAVERLSPRLPLSLAATRLFEGEHIERTGPSGTWAVAAIATPDPTCEARLATDGDALAIVNGPALSIGGDQRRLAGDLLQRFRSTGTAAVAGALGGSYNFVGIAPAIGLRGFSDFSGLSPIYWYEGPDFAAFSNRSTTITSLIGSEESDLRSLAWVIGHANLFGDCMPARPVSYLPPGREAHVGWGDARVRLDVSPVWVWPAPSEDRGRESLDPGEWDEIADALVDNFRSLAAFDGPLRLSLTGGKDSRLCLALAKAAGLRGRVDTFTNGPIGSPEVECAAAVAQAAGFPHTRLGHGAARTSVSRVMPAFEPSVLWRRLRQHAYRFEAIVCPWDGMTDPLRNTTLSIKGFGGELYRGPGGHAKRFKREHPATVEAMAEMFVDYHQPHDPIGVLRRDEVAFQAEWLKSWVYSTAERVRFDLLPEKFYVDYRLGHWNGPMQQATPGRIATNPLLSSSVARKILELSAEANGAERLHFEVMRRAAPELVTVPFLKDAWSPEIAADSRVELPRDGYRTKVSPTNRNLKVWQWRFLESEGKAIARVFREAARETDMGAVCDMKKLRRIGSKSAQIEKVVEAKAVLSGLCAALSLLGRAEPVLDRP